MRYASHRTTRIVPNKFGPYAQRPMENMLVSLPSRQGTVVTRWRIGLTYYWRHGRWPDCDNPQTFNEHVQHRKLFDHDMRMPALADKVAVKQIVADQLGPEWVVPTYWHGSMLPDNPIWPAPFVVKARHGCNQSAFIFGDSADWSAIRRKASRWMKSDYGLWLDEWLYPHIPRGILVEPFVGTAPDLPIDYKVFVFGGRAEFVQVHLGRNERHRWIVFDLDWRRVSAPSADADPARPDTLPAMIAAAEQLAKGFDFVRVDLYEVEGCPLFGEMTFYPGSGLDPFNPVSLDLQMGRYWSAAKIAGG